MTNSEVKKLERMRYELYEKWLEPGLDHSEFMKLSGKIDAIDEIEELLGVTIEQIRDAQ